MFGSALQSQCIAIKSTWSPSKNNQYDISLYQICGLHGLHLVHLESIWSLSGVYLESTHQFGRAPCKEIYMWSPSGLHDSTWTPVDSNWNRWGSVKSSSAPSFS